MASPILIQYLRLDAGYDPILDPNANLTNAEAVAQAVGTRLRLFLGEWWEDLKLGLPVFQSMLGQLASQSTLNAIRAAVQQNVEGAPYVVKVSSVDVTYKNGQVDVTVSYISQFGQQTAATSLPGLSAAIGS